MDEEERVAAFRKLLTDNSFSDFTIKIGSDTIQTHAAIIACRCEELLPFNQDEKSKKKKKHEIKLKDGTIKTGQTLQRLLEYIYTDRIEFSKLSTEEILYVNMGARNLNLTHLVYLCEKWIIENISMDNIFQFLKASNDLNETRVKGFCLTYALQHYTDVISNKDGIKILGIELFQEVVASFNPQAVKTLELPPVVNSTYYNDFKRLFDNMPYSDMTFILDGEQIKAHKSIISAYADSLTQLFKAENSIQFERISSKAFKASLKFLYYGDPNIEQGLACELVPFSKKHRLNSLVKLCEDKIRINVSVETVLDVLTVAYTSLDRPDLNEEIKSKAFPFILENLEKINLATLKLQHPMLVLDLLFRLQDASKKGTIDLRSGYVSQPSPHHNQPQEAYTPPVVAQNIPSPLSASGGFGAYRKNSSNTNIPNTVPMPSPPSLQTPPSVPPNTERRDIPPPPMRAGRPPPPPREKSGANVPPPPARNPNAPPRGLAPPPMRGRGH